MALRIALAQINPTVGDLDGNRRMIEASLAEARPFRPDLIAFPELALSGYPPEDLLHHPPFIRDVEETLGRIAADHPGDRILLGAPIRGDDGLYNAAVLLQGGRAAHAYRKCTLPNYGVFDEKRHFRAGRLCTVYRLGRWRIAVNICEDIWAPCGVPAVQAAAGADVMLNISSSPFHAGKGREREELIRYRAWQHGVCLVYLNLVGGQDELVFDGESLVFAPDGELLARGLRFETDLLILDVDRPRSPAADPSQAPAPPPDGFVQPRHEGIEEIEDELRLEEIDLGPQDTNPPPPLPRRPPQHRIETQEAEIYGALCLGTRDYVRKNGFTDVVIGLSGGIDSALTAVIACDALGAASVHGLTMPGPYTSSTSLAGARELAGNLGISLASIPIDEALAAYRAMLDSTLREKRLGITDENLQARIRGNLLMAHSNALGWLVLTTGNKSEFAVGYCTLYGDMAGGFAVIKDVPKGLVYRLARWRNGRDGGAGPIPGDTLERPPSAELRPDQEDSDTLPPYPVLDRILEARIEREEPIERLVGAGCDPALIRKIYGWIDGNEYKRRQAPPGIKITPRAFGRDRRYPITNRYRGS